MRNFVRQLTSLRNALAPRLILAALLPLIAASASAQLLAASPDALAAGPHTFAGHTPLVVTEGKASLIEHYDSTKMLRLSFSLNVPHPAEESQFLEDLQNKHSPLFHQYLTPEEWNARFAPSVEDEQAIVDWATSQGFTITYRYPNRLLLDVEAPAGVIERALHVTLNSYQLPNEADGTLGEKGFANDRDPILPSELSSKVLSVMGLNSFEHVNPGIFGKTAAVPPDYTPGPAIVGGQIARADATVQPGQATSQDSDPGTQSFPAPSENNGYYPKDIWSQGAYDTDALMAQGHCCNPTGNANNSPPESSIAIAAYGDLDLNDVAGFHSGFPYLAYNVEKFLIDGGYTCKNSPNPDGACGEVTLDTEWSLAMANSQSSSSTTAKVYVYEGPNYSDKEVASVYNHIATDGHAKTVSTSWACEEINCWPKTDMMSLDTIFASMAGEGFTLLASSGDQGSTAGCGSTLAINFPPSDPNVIAVGGTKISLFLPGDGYNYEVDWTGGTNAADPTANPPKPDACGGNNGGSTGGFSQVFPVPAYQANMGFNSRANPDVSLDSVGFVSFFDLGGWSGVGGTSLATPMMAGFVAQANAYLLSLGNVCGTTSSPKSCGTLGNVNYPMYEEGKDHNAAHIPFYDITSGCSSNDLTIKYNLKAYCATVGFDEATGWGTVNMLQMAYALNWETVTANGSPSTHWFGPATNKWYNSNQNVSWTIFDNIGSDGGTPTGSAGFTQGWDSIPADSTTQAHGNPGGVNDSFYNGPQFPNATNGCLALASGQGCSGGVSQGCHTAHVRGWNNMGQSTGDTTYGPVCYDTVAPTVTLTTSPDVFSGIWTRVGSTITLTATDPGGSGASGIAHTYYGLDKFNCNSQYPGNCSVYTGPFTVSTQGAHVINYFTVDNAGNISATGTFDLDIDLTAPVTVAGFSGTFLNGQYESAVTVTLTATDTGGSGVKHTSYSVDGAVYNVYTGPFTISTPGTHTIKYESNDNAGNEETLQTSTINIASLVSTSLTANPTTSSFGQPVTLTATIVPALSGGSGPTGTVTFYDSNGNTNLGSAALTGLSASLTAYSLPVGSNSLYAVYNGATYYVASTSTGTVNETVTTTTTTTLTSSINPTVYGNFPTLTATVKAAAGATPTGTVTFKDGATILNTVTLAANGTAVLTKEQLSVGTHTITAIYAGTVGDPTSTSSAVSQVVTILPSTITLKSSLNPASFASAVTFTATITAAYQVLPAGTLTFKDGTKTLTTFPLNGSNIVTYTVTNLTPGAHSITAVYSGSPNESPSTSAALTETVNADATNTALTSSLNPASFGTPVTFTAVVTASAGNAPTGKVTFMDGTTVLATETLNVNATATYTSSTLAEGKHPITAVYVADTDDAGSTSSMLTETINPATTATTVTSSLNPAAFGATVKFTAVVTAASGATPTGTVTFKSGSTVLGTGTLASGKATFSTGTLPAGTLAITAVYTADTDDATSTSTALSQVIDPANTTTTLTAPLKTYTYGSSITLTATVKAATGTTPTGKVTFMSGMFSLGSGNLNASGVATLTTTSLGIGSDSVTAVYAGDASDATSTSAVFPETITGALTTTTLTTNFATAAYGSTVTLAATVKADAGSTPAGTVTFKSGSTVIGTGTLSSGKTAISTKTLPVGMDSITAVYAADTADAASTSPALVETITAANTTTLNSTPAAPAFGTPITFQTTVKTTDGSIPTGTVTAH